MIVVAFLDARFHLLPVSFTDCMVCEGRKPLFSWGRHNLQSIEGGLNRIEFSQVDDTPQNRHSMSKVSLDDLRWVLSIAVSFTGRCSIIQ